VTATAQDAVDNTRSIGVALGSCQVPGAAGPTFTLGENEIEMGMGIHGEPGIWRDTLRPGDAVAEEMLRRVLDDTPASAGKQVSVLMNSLGATPVEELLILYRRIRRLLDGEGYEIVQPLVGHYATSMEMAGASLSLLFLDETRRKLLAAPATCPFWRV
jgi:dihydroxyacetone kinase-like protein